MQRNRLHAEQIVALRDCAGNRDSPAVVVGDHRASGPAALLDGSREQAFMRNLELKEFAPVSRTLIRGGHPT